MDQSMEDSATAPPPADVSLVLDVLDEVAATVTSGTELASALLKPLPLLFADFTL